MQITNITQHSQLPDPPWVSLPCVVVAAQLACIFLLFLCGTAKRLELLSINDMKKRMNFATLSRFAAAFIALQLSPPVLCAEISGEILLQPRLEEYEVVFTAEQGIASIMEMVPRTESAEDWTEMLTTRQFDDMSATPQKFRSAMTDELHEVCKGGESRLVEEGDENGYEAAVWLQVCPLNPTTGKPEYTWLKAIRGNEKFYVVQKAFRFEPSEDQIRQWTQYLKDSSLCETRSSDHPCPKF